MIYIFTAKTVPIKLHPTTLSKMLAISIGR